MILPFLVLLLGLQQDSAQQLAAQRAQIDRLQQEVERVNSELKETRAILQNEMKATCSSESRLQTNALKVADAGVPVRLNLLSMVSNPSDCLPAEIRVTATYSDPSDGLVCTGSVVMGQATQVQNISFEVRPYELETFLKWWDGPTLKQQSLVCRDYQGVEVRSPTDYASSVRIYVTALPKRGGMSTSEFQLSLPRIQRQ
jgi:hypothetical protein